MLDLMSVVEMPLERDAKIDIKISPQCLRTAITLCGRLFPPWAEVPSGAISRRDDIPRTINSMITILSGMPGTEATAALQDLVANSGLSSWRDTLRHALQEHLKKEREANFVPPTTTDVGRALATGQPANAADMKALVCAELRGIGEELKHGATGGYKAFWNTTAKGRLLSPKGEDECRDRLVDWLRPRLGRLGIRIEPESRFAESKRADMKVMFGPSAVPVEVKQHMNRRLWTAPVEQLAAQYTVDPEARGCGIYLVLYYGSGMGVGAMPLPPKGRPRPKGANQLEVALQDLLPCDLRHRVAVVVLDVSKPPR